MLRPNPSVSRGPNAECRVAPSAAVTIGGRADENAQMGALIGPAVPYAEVADVIEDIVEAYLALRDRAEELFVDTVKRLGVEPFRERVYATR